MMAKFTFLWMYVMATCCMSIVMSLVPVVYNVQNTWCDETKYSSSQQLINILEQLSSDNHITPPAIENSCDCIEVTFTENLQVNATYENSTFIVKTFEEQATNDCPHLEPPPISEALMAELQNTSKEFQLTSLPMEEIDSCKNLDPDSPSGNYSITTSSGSKVQVYCDMEGENCGRAGGWMRVAYVDMTQADSQCPQGLNQETLEGNNYCRTFTYNVCRCVSTVFQAHNIKYTQVCGRVSGYQLGSPNGFYNYYKYQQNTIEGYYVDGVSLTHGQPRKHIWTYSAALQSFPATDNGNTCPCYSNNNNFPSPPFVGHDYYCESGTNETYTSGKFYPDDTLWDGEQCDGFEGPCCTQYNMPWFIKTLGQTARDDIELRMCFSSGNEDTLLNIIELYIR